MPFRNAGGTIRDAVDSIIGQTFTHFELLAVADHSQDDTLATLKSYRDSRIKITDNSGEGLVDALNHGISQCRASWIVPNTRSRPATGNT